MDVVDVVDVGSKRAGERVGIYSLDLQFGTEEKDSIVFEHAIWNHTHNDEDQSSKHSYTFAPV